MLMKHSGAGHPAMIIADLKNQFGDWIGYSV